MLAKHASTRNLLAVNLHAVGAKQGTRAKITPTQGVFFAIGIGAIFARVLASGCAKGCVQSKGR